MGVSMEQTKGTYKPKYFLCDEEGNIHKTIFECDEIIVKEAKEVEAEQNSKNLKKKEEWDDFKQLINSKCGSFYFYFYNEGLMTLPIQESIKMRFLYLCTCMKYTKSGSYIESHNHKLMKRKHIEEVLGLSTSEFNKTMKVLLETGLIYQEGEHFLVNKNLIKRGDLTKIEVKKDYTRIFDDAIRELYKNCTTKQHKQLYYLFNLLPYVSMNFNAICQNPDAEFVEHIIPLKLSEICEVVGYNPKNSRRFEREMLQLQLFNQYAIVGVKCGSGIWYKINPRILYAGSKKYIDELLNLLSTDFSIKITPKP